MKLLPCPFCGGVAELHHVGNYHTKKRLSVIECKTFGCFATARVVALIHDFDWMDEKVIEKWNQRTLPQEVQDVIDAAKRWLGVDINDTTALDISYDDLRDAINSYEEATSERI